MDFSSAILTQRERFFQLEAEASSPTLYDNASRAREILREHSRLRELLADWDALQSLLQQVTQSEELAVSGGDAELVEMAREEIRELKKQIETLQKAVQIGLLPPDPGEDKDAIVEIRAGTGGTEAALFAADLFRMYSRYAEASGLQLEAMDSSPAELGGFKQIVFRVGGSEVFRRLRYESGVHRVQRVPATEAQGRIHTSAATVAVLPEAEEVDIEIRPEDIRVEVCRSGGPGGQGVNTTDSAVQILHLPTGKIVRCQDGRSQIQNRERAMQILRSRLLEEKIRAEQEKYSAHRKSLIGSGGREEKIRTYNFPQNRITDHRIEKTLYSLDRFMEGEIGELLESLEAADLDQRLREAGMSDNT